MRLLVKKVLEVSQTRLREHVHLSGFRLKYCTHDLKFNVIMQTIKHWQYYLAYKEGFFFFLNTDHQVLKFEFLLSCNNSNFQLGTMLGCLIKLQSIKVCLLNFLHPQVVGFDFFKNSYRHITNIGRSCKHCNQSIELHIPNTVHNGFIFEGLKLLIKCKGDFENFDL